MIELNFPRYSFSIKRQGDKALIFDEFRKKWIVLTPEEWVRQHVLMYVFKEKGYPKSLISVEKLVNVNGLKQRFDAVLFNNNARPIAIIECKSPSIKITEEVFYQALRYNAQIGAPYIVLTNGINTYCGNIDIINKKFSYIKEIPSYKNL